MKARPSNSTCSKARKVFRRVTSCARHKFLQPVRKTLSVCREGFLFAANLFRIQSRQDRPQRERDKKTNAVNCRRNPQRNLAHPARFRAAGGVCRTALLNSNSWHDVVGGHEAAHDQETRDRERENLVPRKRHQPRNKIEHRSNRRAKPEEHEQGRQSAAQQRAQRSEQREVAEYCGTCAGWCCHGFHFESSSLIER